MYNILYIPTRIPLSRWPRDNCHYYYYFNLTNVADVTSFVMPVINMRTSSRTDVSDVCFFHSNVIRFLSWFSKRCGYFGRPSSTNISS